MHTEFFTQHTLELSVTSALQQFESFESGTMEQLTCLPPKHWILNGLQFGSDANRETPWTIQVIMQLFLNRFP